MQGIEESEAMITDYRGENLILMRRKVVTVYLVHRIVAHRAVVVRLRAIIATVYAHPVSGHVLRATRWRRRHHRRRGALAGTTHTVRRRSCKSCCRNNRGAYKIRGCVFLSSSASPIHFVYRKKYKWARF